MIIELGKNALFGLQHEAIDVFVDLFAIKCRENEDNAAIVFLPLAMYQASPLEALQHPSEVWSFAGEAVSDRQGGYAMLAGLNNAFQGQELKPGQTLVLAKIINAPIKVAMNVYYLVVSCFIELVSVR